MSKTHLAVKFQIGDTAQHAIAASSAKLEKDCMRGVCIYQHSLSFSEEERITITMNPSTPTSLQFDDAVDITLGTFRNDVINDAEVTLGGVPSYSAHALAIDYFYRQIDMLIAKGWHRFIMHNEARISGREIQKFDNLRTLFGKRISTGPFSDPQLRLTQEQWLEMPNFSIWYFYKEGIYLKLRVQSENDDKTPSETGSYLFTLTILSEDEFYKSIFKGQQRDEWKSLLPDFLKQAAVQRAETEVRLRKMNINIDEAYQDPIIKALQ